MTGRYCFRTGLYNTRFGGDTLGLDEVTIAQTLKKAGYRTGCFGKWHLGKYAPYQPHNRGFDEFLGHYHGHIDEYDYPDQIRRFAQIVLQVVQPPDFFRRRLALANLAGQLPLGIRDCPAIVGIRKVPVPGVIDEFLMLRPSAGDK